MSYTKGDGAKIAIRFSDSVTVNGSSQTAFTVIVPEYSYVPGGTLQNVTKSVESVSGYEGISEVINMSNGTDLTNIQREYKKQKYHWSYINNVHTDAKIHISMIN